jgi:hypothetical protein
VLRTIGATADRFADARVQSSRWSAVAHLLVNARAGTAQTVI